jgi:hypothetical protein
VRPFLFWFWLAGAQRNVGKFEEAGASGVTNLAVIPGAISILAF